MRFSKVGVLAVMAGAMMFATAAQAARVGIVVYQEDHFGGDSREIRDDQPDLGWIHFDDRISSVEVKRGVWELCEHANYGGRCITLDHDVGKLDRMGFDDRISSIRRIH